MVLGQLLITPRLVLYSAARPSKRNGLTTIRCDTEYLACAGHLRRAGLSTAAKILVELRERADKQTDKQTCTHADRSTQSTYRGK